MKLIIPPECLVGAIHYKICYDDRLMSKMDLCAHITSVDQRIYLSHRKPDQEFHSLIHEAIHGIFGENGMGEASSNEQLVGVLSVGIANFLTSLGIEPDFSQIPEEES